MHSPALVKTARLLSAVIGGLMFVAALGGLTLGGLYRDEPWLTAVWRANDVVTAFVALPIFMGSLVLSMRGRARATLVWLGMIDYALYNSAYYVFGAAFNAFFLIYVAIFALSIVTAIFALAELDVAAIGGSFALSTPVRWISGYMSFVALGLSAVYAGQSLDFALTGSLDDPTKKIIFAIDLSLLVPPFVLGAWWLWRRKAWGYVLGVALNVKSSVYMIVLALGTIAASSAGREGASAQVPLWIALGLASIAASSFLLSRMRAMGKA